jgi:uncharacterized protein YbjT (DUF2867 family)
MSTSTGSEGEGRKSLFERAGVRVQLVLGTTGSLGSAIVNKLTSSGIPVRALVRDPTTKRVLTDPGNVELVEGSIEVTHTLKKSFAGVDIFYKCVNV